MFKQVGSGLLIYCDNSTRCLRVATDAPLVPGFKKSFREIALFTSEEKWLESPYPAQITNEDVLDMIDWFWTDLERTTERKPVTFVCRWHGCKKTFESEFGAFCPHCCRFQTSTEQYPCFPEPSNDT